MNPREREREAVVVVHANPSTSFCLSGSPG